MKELIIGRALVLLGIGGVFAFGFAELHVAMFTAFAVAVVGAVVAQGGSRP